MATPLSRVSLVRQKQQQQIKEEDSRFGKTMAQTPGVTSLFGKMRAVPNVNIVKEATGGDRKKVELLFNMRQSFSSSGF
jgi:hypothetical protein